MPDSGTSAAPARCLIRSIGLWAGAPSPGLGPACCRGQQGPAPYHVQMACIPAAPRRGVLGPERTASLSVRSRPRGSRGGARLQAGTGRSPFTARGAAGAGGERSGGETAARGHRPAARPPGERPTVRRPARDRAGLPWGGGRPGSGPGPAGVRAGHGVAGPARIYLPGLSALRFRQVARLLGADLMLVRRSSLSWPLRRTDRRSADSAGRGRHRDPDRAGGRAVPRG